MVLEEVHCPHCDSCQIGRHGQLKDGRKRYICHNEFCPCTSFMQDYIYHGCEPKIEERIIDMTQNASGIRDTARVLGISPTTVIKVLKSKEEHLKSVNQALLDDIHNPH